MSDRCSVSLYIREDQAEAFEAIPETERIEEDRMICPMSIVNNETQTEALYEYDEVNYGELKFLPILQAQGIAYEAHWCSGSEYEEGIEYCRFTKEGELDLKIIYTSDRGPAGIELIKCLNDGVYTNEQRLDRISKIIRVWEKTVTILPWDNQIEYGRIYRTVQLILPTGKQS